MPLTPATRLGPYEVVAPLGAGGMGEVYRARDTRLGREVAIKALPDALARDREQVSRLLREARVLASLNHPNIGAIFGLEESGDRSYLVLELIEGRTLADRLRRGPLPIPEAIGVCRQIAAGLEAAHESGIIHRDLKPGNVMLTRADEVKVLDFGLAKEVGAAGDPAFTAALTVSGTAEGTVLGTAAYMSPEQASGRPLDRRTDIWAFGCVLYECLSGRPVFSGDSYAEIVAQVLHAEPDWAALPATTPLRVRELLGRCLTRDPRRRLRDIGEARIALEELGVGEAGGARGVGQPPAALERERVAAAAAGPSPGTPRWTGSPRGLAAIVLAVALVAVLAGVAFTRLPPRAPTQPLLHVDLNLPDSLALYGWGSPVLAFSPDGRTLAYSASGPSGTARIYVHGLADGVVREVPGSESGEGPFFSPDGRWVAFAVGVSLGFQAPSELRKYSLSTGLTQTVCAVRDYFGGFWEGDRIVWSDQLPGPLMQVPAAGGTRTRFIPAAKDTAYAPAWPQPLPGGRYVLVTDWSEPVSSLTVIDRHSGARRKLGVEATFARYIPGGLLLYVTRDGQVMGVRFDPKRATRAGEPVAVMKDVSLSGAEAAVLAISNAGHLAWSTGLLRRSGIEEMRLVRVGASGALTPLPVETDQYTRRVRVSPDGRRLVVSDEHRGPWLVELDRGRRSRIVQASGYEFPAWTPDGSALVFTQDGAPITFQRVEARAGATPHRVAEVAEESYVDDVTPDGRSVIYTGPFSGDIRSVPLAGTGSPQVLLRGAGAYVSALSPDGRWFAYASAVTGKPEVFVERVGGGDRVQVSTTGGTLPRWARDGREIYFVSGERLMAARFAPGQPADVGVPVALATVPDLRGYDVLPGRREFVALQRQPGAGYIRRLHLALGWTPELERMLKQGLAKRLSR